MIEILGAINQVAWVLGNIAVAYIAVGVIAFVVCYYIFFDPRATTAGKLIFRLFLSLVGIIGVVFIGIFIDPSGDQNWYKLSDEVDIWRPLVRLYIYGYVAFTITSLALFLWFRKFRPNRIKAAPDLGLVKVRNDTQEIQS